MGHHLLIFLGYATDPWSCQTGECLGYVSLTQLLLCMSFSHSRLMFPCEEVNVAMRDPVVKSEHQPHLQATELRTNTEGKIPVAKQGRRAGKYRGHLDVSSLEGQAGSEEPITTWETSTKNPLSHGAQPGEMFPSIQGLSTHGKKQKSNTNFSEMRPCQLKTSAGTSSDQGTGEKMGSSSGAERNDKVLAPPTGSQSHPTCTSLSRPQEALRGCSGLILHLKPQM